MRRHDDLTIPAPFPRDLCTTHVSSLCDHVRSLYHHVSSLCDPVQSRELPVRSLYDHVSSLCAPCALPVRSLYDHVSYYVCNDLITYGSVYNVCSYIAVTLLDVVVQELMDRQLGIAGMGVVNGRCDGKEAEIITPIKSKLPDYVSCIQLLITVVIVTHTAI